MNETLIIEKAYVMRLVHDDDYQTHYIEFELPDDTVENLEEWEKFFGEHRRWRLRLTIEAVEK